MAIIKYFESPHLHHMIILLNAIAERLNKNSRYWYNDNELHYTCNICKKNFDRNSVGIEKHATYHLNKNNLLPFI